MDKLNHKNKANWERSGVKKKKKKITTTQATKNHA